MLFKQMMILAAILLTGGTLMAQQSKRIVLIEHFTNTECPICTSRNPGLHETLGKYSGQANHISYHPPVPYQSCIYYQANKIGNQARADFYSVSGSPRAYVDGKKTSGSSLLPESAMDEALAQSAPVALMVEENNLTRTASVTVLTTGTVSAQNLRLFVALVERETDYNSPNGEKKHFNVFRKFVNLDGPEGQSFIPAAVGGSVTYNYAYSYDGAWGADQMYVLAFVQDVSAKRILNSATAEDQTTGVDEAVAADRSVRLSPNPVLEQLKIEASESYEEVKIYHLTGQLMYRIPIKENRFEWHINLSGVRPGLYLLSLENKESRVVKKFMKW